MWRKNNNTQIEQKKKKWYTQKPFRLSIKSRNFQLKPFLSLRSIKRRTSYKRHLQYAVFILQSLYSHTHIPWQLSRFNYLTCVMLVIQCCCFVFRYLFSALFTVRFRSLYARFYNVDNFKNYVFFLCGFFNSRFFKRNLYLWYGLYFCRMKYQKLFSVEFWQAIFFFVDAYDLSMNFWKKKLPKTISATIDFTVQTNCAYLQAHFNQFEFKVTGSYFSGIFRLNSSENYSIFFSFSS